MTGIAMRRERPRGRRAAKQRDDVAPLHAKRSLCTNAAPPPALPTSMINSRRLMGFPPRARIRDQV